MKISFIFIPPLSIIDLSTLKLQTDTLYRFWDFGTVYESVYDIYHREFINSLRYLRYIHRESFFLWINKKTGTHNSLFHHQSIRFALIREMKKYAFPLFVDRIKELFLALSNFRTKNLHLLQYAGNLR